MAHFNKPVCRLAAAAGSQRVRLELDAPFSVLRLCFLTAFMSNVGSLQKSRHIIVGTFHEQNISLYEFLHNAEMRRLTSPAERYLLMREMRETNVLQKVGSA